MNTTVSKPSWVLVGVLLILLIGFLAACTAPRFEQLQAIADTLAQQANFDRRIVHAGQFNLLSYSKITNSNKPVTVYIEGDGKAWVTRNRWSINPTPHNPLALKLAVNDSLSANIIYLARPCQYRSGDMACTPQYWTSHRYSEPVVSSLNTAINLLLARYRLSSIDLVGYSGGGALALLIAVRRSDINTIRTVAGNLNTDAFIRLHKASPLTGSLNPANIINTRGLVTQLHFVGEFDQVVPRTIAHSYTERLASTKCVNIVTVRQASHEQGWVPQWRALLQWPFPCQVNQPIQHFEK